MHELDLHKPDSPHRPPTRTATDAARQQLRELGITTDLMTAADILGIGRTRAYRQANAGTFPVTVVRTGRNFRVVVARIIDFLGLHEEPRG